MLCIVSTFQLGEDLSWSLIKELIGGLNGVVWGPPMLILILGTGFFLMVGLRAMPLMRLGYGFRMLWAGRKEQGEGDITPFNALMTSLSATIGTGNIAGVGDGHRHRRARGAVLDVVHRAGRYGHQVRRGGAGREVPRGRREAAIMSAGPCTTSRTGWARTGSGLARAFAVFGALAGFGIGNTVQANSVADALETKFHVDYWITGVVMALLVGLVLIGGIRWIAQVAGKLVPFHGHCLHPGWPDGAGDQYRRDPARSGADCYLRLYAQRASSAALPARP